MVMIQQNLISFLKISLRHIVYYTQEVETKRKILTKLIKIRKREVKCKIPVGQVKRSLVP